ncbi:MAG: hypothetical protein EBZ58_09860 [Bacteroidetes bacterium]|nr:hypothetical protein [Bacteroidota bacterium]
MALAEKTRLKGTKYDIGGFAIRNRYISKPNKARTVEAWSERITDDELGNLRTFDPKNLVDALMIMRPAV